MASNRPDGPRALIVTPNVGDATPVGVYLSSSRFVERGTLPVAGLDLLSLATREPGGPLKTPRPPNPPAPVPGFRLLDRVEGSTFTLVRYRAPRPLPVSAAELAERSLTGDRGVVWLLP